MPTQEVDLALPPAALLQRRAGEPHAFLLDGGGPRSWGDGHAWLGLRPTATLSFYAGGHAVIRCGERESARRGDPFALLEAFAADHAADPGDGSFGGMVIAALSYDLCHHVERLRTAARPAPGTLLLFAAAYDRALSFSYYDRRYRLHGAPGVASALSLAELRDGPPVRPRATSHRPPLAEQAKARHLEAVRAALEHIAAGNIYQVNLAQRFAGDPPASAAATFEELVGRHPMPFGAYLDCGPLSLVSSSPECFLAIDGDRIATFPIKGTRPRGLDPGRDRTLIAELRSDPKERAEHVMIVDLERNDLGRICRPGTVSVDELMQVESFPSLHHMVSKVSGRLEDGIGLAAILRATFPGGSITGAPKIRAMEIIAELEAAERSFYTGAIGLLCGRRAVFNIAIRTAIVTADRMLYHAGGGIVADSDPEREYDETLLKAQPLLSLFAASAA